MPNRTRSQYLNPIDAINGSVVAPVFFAAKTTPLFTNNTRAADFFMFYSSRSDKQPTTIVGKGFQD